MPKQKVEHTGEKKPVEHRRVERGELAKFLTVAQTAERLGLSRPTVYAMIRRGQLAASRVGGQWFVSPAVVTALLPAENTPAKPSENQTTGPQEPTESSAKC